jgi:DNA-binding NtrC family response regulator
MEPAARGAGLRHALVVDNEKSICEALQFALEDTGAYRVSCALSATEAVAILDNDPPDIAVIDALLPGKESGAELIVETLSRGIPAVVMTGAPQMMGDLHRAAVPHLLKPFRFPQFLATIENTYAELRGSPDSVRALAAKVTALQLDSATEQMLSEAARAEASRIIQEAQSHPEDEEE